VNSLLGHMILLLWCSDSAQANCNGARWPWSETLKLWAKRNYFSFKLFMSRILARWWKIDK
jgi:hypothetical protein